MTLDPRLKGRLKGGRVEFFCECGGLPQPATTAETGEDIVMVCSAGHPLGQWSTEEERAGELNSFAHDVRLHSARAARPLKKPLRERHNEKYQHTKPFSSGGHGQKRTKKRYGKNRGKS